MLPSTKVHLLIESDLRFLTVQSPRQPTRSVTVALESPSTSSSAILWPLSERSPADVSCEAFLTRGDLRWVDLFSKSVMTWSVRRLSDPRRSSSDSAREVWK